MGGQSQNALDQRAFTNTFKGVPAGIGNTSKFMTQMQRVGLQKFYQSPERAMQLQLLQRMGTGQDFGLTPEEAGRIQEQGRAAQEAAFRQSTDQIGNMYAGGSLTSGQQQSLGSGALYARSAGLADFQRQEYLRQLEEARQRPLFQTQAIESYANALTGIPNFNQINELLKTRIMAQQAALGSAGGPLPPQTQATPWWRSALSSLSAMGPGAPSAQSAAGMFR